MKHAILGLLLLGLAIADHPLDWERDLEDPSIYRQDQTRDTTYRLPENVIPLEYDIDIDLNFVATVDREEYSFDGKVTIVVQALEENVTQIVLHANVDRINGLTIFNNENTPVLLDPSSPMILEPQYHFLRINLAQNMMVGTNYTLAIDYSNTMNEGPLRRGIWRGNYTDWFGATRTYATTHFQPYNARQAFPCWDEPLFKAVFTVHLTHPTGFSRVFSNTELESRETLTNGRIRDNFLATPKMSSYLVTFLVSESFTVIAEDRNFNPPIRIIGRSNALGLGFPVLTMAVRMTEFFDGYFGIPYSSLHPNLLNDHISSPDWASAGTENWGMVSYRELYMILDPSVTLMSVWHYSATLVSHELAHKWFGNLITCYWWSNTWINEGFASYFGYIATYEVFPEFEHHEHFNSRYLQTSLAFDSGTGTVAMNHDVNTPAQVTGHFGTISYSKGAAFLRMVADMIGEDAFRAACQYFLRDNAYLPTNATHLFDAFNQAATEAGTLNEYQNQNFNFSNYYYTWVNEPGYPILNVNINYTSGQMTLTQERFFLNGNAPTGQIYPIPITYSTASNPTFTLLKPSVMMSTASEVLTKAAGEEWVIFNNQQHGHYRVNYDDQSWQLISEALINEPDSIHHLNRAQVVDDVFALMRSGRMDYQYGFGILKFLRHETNYHVWDAAITGYTWLRNRLRHIPSRQSTFDAFILSYMEHAIETLGYDVQDNETPTITMSRQDMLHFACLLGHERCVQESRSRFVALRENGQTVNPGIKRNVFVVGVREGGEEDYNYLFNRFIQSNYANDQLEMLRAMAATRDQNILITRFLPMTLTFVVRTQDKVNAFNYALLGNPENANTVLEFVMNNIDRIRDAYQADAPNNPVHTVLSNLAAYLDESALTVYENWLRTTQSTSAQFATGISAITAARTNMEWGTNNVDIIVGAARDGAAQIVVSATILAVSAMFAMSF